MASQLDTKHHKKHDKVEKTEKTEYEKVEKTKLEPTASDAPLAEEKHHHSSTSDKHLDSSSSSGGKHHASSSETVTETKHHAPAADSDHLRSADKHHTSEKVVEKPTVTEKVREVGQKAQEVADIAVAATLAIAEVIEKATNFAEDVAIKAEERREARATERVAERAAIREEAIAAAHTSSTASHTAHTTRASEKTTAAVASPPHRANTTANTSDFESTHISSARRVSPPQAKATVATFEEQRMPESHTTTSRTTTVVDNSDKGLEYSRTAAPLDTKPTAGDKITATTKAIGDKLKGRGADTFSEDVKAKTQEEQAKRLLNESGHHQKSQII